MSKRIRTAQRARGKRIKASLESISKRLDALLTKVEHSISSDAESLVYCLAEAKHHVDQAVEFYTEYV